MLNPSSPAPDPPPPDEPGITLQANAINVSGDVVGRDKTTNNITNFIHKAFLGGANEERDRRNRRIMLDKVRTFWVKGVLEQSLHGAALIELGMEYKPDAVQYPWNTVLQRPDRSPQPLSHGAKMIEVFDGEGSELLILGAPGSGKTTMLLDLARDLITRAEQDETLPIPVVFNLSSWAEKPRSVPLAEWLIEELSFRYDVPKKVGKTWIEKDQVLPLLDGLDEVKLEQRAACVEAINNFRKDHLIHLAVCSRRAEYEALRAQLRLQSAIVLQPLTREQIDVYLQSAGEQLVSVRALLQNDAALQELAESPLMLSIMVLAYRNLDASILSAFDSVEQQRQHLFDTYIQRMFERRGVDKRYTARQAIHWLSWLARRMVEHTQTTFYLERMQPDWLPIRSRGIYSKEDIRTSAKDDGAVVPDNDIAMLHKEYFQTSAKDDGLIMLYNGVQGLAEAIYKVLERSIEALERSIEAYGSKDIWQVWAEAAGELHWSWSDTEYEQVQSHKGAGIGALMEAVILRKGIKVSEIKTVEVLLWSWSDVRDELIKQLKIGLLGGLIAGLIMGLDKKLDVGLIFMLVVGLLIGLFFGLFLGLALGLLSGLKVGSEIEMKTIPNEGVWRSARNAILSGLVFGLIAGPVIGLITGFGVGLITGFGIGLDIGLVSGLIGVLAFGLCGGLVFGGAACIQHFILHLILYRNGSIPLNYVRFLDYCAERIFLRKVGGGYIFVHRLLMEHFAGIESLKH